MSGNIKRALGQLLEIIEQFDVAMIVTRHRDGTISSRPMAIAGCTPEAHLWMITHVEGQTVKDITENSQIVACMQASQRFVSLSGLARATRDPQRIDELWETRQAVWFDKGKNDPSVILLEIVPTYAEFWDRSGANRMKFAIRELHAWLSGNTLDESAGQHGQLRFPSRKD